MPVFLCRWQNGDVTFAAAADKAQAIGLLDLELDYAEDWQLTKINEFLLGLALTDEGEFEIDFIGEALSEQLNKTYPILAEARIQIAESGDRISSDQAKRILAEAVAKERARLEKATSPNADRTASTYHRMMKTTYGIPKDADIIVTSPDSTEIKLLAEVKRNMQNPREAEEQLKNWMMQLSSPVGLIITPENLSIYSDRYRSQQPESIEKVGEYVITHLLDFDSVLTVSGGSAESVLFENYVQRWLESLPQTATAERVNNSDLWRALNIYVLPAIENGIVRAAAPRYR